jgi:hypothetical protein
MSPISQVLLVSALTCAVAGANTVAYLACGVGIALEVFLAVITYAGDE